MSIYGSVKCQSIEAHFFAIGNLIFSTFFFIQLWNCKNEMEMEQVGAPDDLQIQLQQVQKKCAALTLRPGTCICEIFTSSSLLPLNFMCTLFWAWVSFSSFA